MSNLIHSCLFCFVSFGQHILDFISLGEIRRIDRKAEPNRRYFGVPGNNNIKLFVGSGRASCERLNQFEDSLNQNSNPQSSRSTSNAMIDCRQYCLKVLLLSIATCRKRNNVHLTRQR